MARSNSRGGRNNNPSGRNQYSDWGVMDVARERPFAAAAAAAGAAAAGLFLWSRRAQISNQLSSLSDQIGEWSENMSSSWSSSGDDTGGLATSGQSSNSTGSSSRTSNAGMSETGGGNASLGRSSGGGGSSGSASGRGRARSSAATQQ